MLGLTAFLCRPQNTMIANICQFLTHWVFTQVTRPFFVYNQTEMIALALVQGASTKVDNRPLSISVFFMLRTVQTHVWTPSVTSVQCYCIRSSQPHKDYTPPKLWYIATHLLKRRRLHPSLHPKVENNENIHENNLLFINAFKE